MEKVLYNPTVKHLVVIDEKHRKVKLPKHSEMTADGWKFDGWYEEVDDSLVHDAKRLGGSGETIIVNVDDLYAHDPQAKMVLTKYNELCIQSHYSK